eukprot:3788533-Prymnesium_polylepis.1
MLTFLAPAADDTVRQRGKHAKRARAAGEEVEAAAVAQVSEWAAALGMSRSTTWRHLKAAVERRAKLDESESCGYWLASRQRKARRISDEVHGLVHQFYIDHPSIKRSPIASDVLTLKTGPNPEDRIKVAKLLSEVSLTDVYLDFRKAHPDVKIGERSFRKLRPQELRRMTTRHLDMCGCRCAGGH